MDDDVAREFAALKARCDDIERRLAGLLQLATEALAQNIGQRAVAAVALAEIALMHKDPREKVSMMAASFLGVLDAAGQMLRKEAATAALMTKEVEAIVSMAEAVLPAPRADPPETR